MRIETYLDLYNHSMMNAFACVMSERSPAKYERRLLGIRDYLIKRDVRVQAKINRLESEIEAMHESNWLQDIFDYD